MQVKRIRELPFREVYLPPCLTEAETNAKLGTLLNDSDFDEDKIFRENVNAYCAETKAPLFFLRRGIISKELVVTAFNSFLKAAGKSYNRGMASGSDPGEEALSELLRLTGAVAYRKAKGNATRYEVLCSDGSWSNTSYAAPINSGVAGFYPKTPRVPYCRLTAFTQNHVEEFRAGLPLVHLVDNVYKALVPDSYALQREEANRTSPDFVIKDTSFTTITVNKNWQTACHTDKGDFEQGFGNLVALRKGKYSGGFTILPRYRAGVDLQNGDVLLMDVHKVHGNSKIVKMAPGAVRLSLVHYYRADMINCGTQKDELEEARRKRQKLL